MKNTFKSFKNFSEEEYRKYFSEAHFIFDTNVLLNLYRYQEETKDQFLQVLETISDKIWIPYHVGLEFNRNRITVINDQNKKFDEIHKVLDKSENEIKNEFKKLDIDNRHSLIKYDKFFEEHSKLFISFKSELNILKTKQQQIRDKDEIKEKIENIFNGKIGTPPEKQEYIDKLNKEGENRYINKIPPGYEDQKKEEVFAFGGIQYHGKYGDLIIWKEIIEHAKKDEIKSIIFITDDKKEDWWQITSGQKISPRIELINEIQRESDIDFFYIYSPEKFLTFAKDLMEATITESTIEEVRYLSKTHSRRPSWVTKIIIDRIKIWFFTNYDDPANFLPYDSREDGYQYLFGGPYDLRDLIFSKYGDDYPERLLNKVIEDIEEEYGHIDWAMKDRAIHVIVSADFETAERIGASGTFQVSSILDHNGFDLSHMVDQGKHYYSQNEVIDDLADAMMIDSNDISYEFD